MSILQLSLACGEPLLVHHFTIREALSSLFAVSVVARSPEPSLDFDAIVGRPAALRVVTGYRFARDGGWRRWAGVCSRIERVHALEKAPSEAGLSTYELQIVPALWLLTQRQNHRLFQHLSVPEIAGRLLEEWEILARWQLGDSYPRLELRVQYGESDYSFLCRLLEEAGIAFCFMDTDEGSSRLVLGDTMHRSPPRPGPPIVFADNPSDAGEREYVTHVGFGQEVRPGALAIRDHDFRRPALPLLAEAPRVPGFEGKLEVFSYRPGAFLVETDRRDEGTPAADDRGFARHDLRHGAALAARALEAARVGRRAVSFQTNAIDLRPGTIFIIDGDPAAEIDGVSLLVSELWIEGAPGTEWIMRGRALFAAEPYRPPLITPKPVVQGPEIAIVVGPPAQEIHTDEHGRIRVQFRWDREGRGDERSSCWIRVVQGGAGTGFGMIALPRVGQEVVIGYLGGDPDQPIVIGRFFNGIHPVPFKLPEHATQSGWRSLSSPGGNGFNELRFEDKSGAELVSVRAERDLRALVRQDEALTVGRHRAKVIGGDETARTERQFVTYVGQDLHATVIGDLRQHIGGTRSLIIDGDQHALIGGAAALDADGPIHVRSRGPIVIEAPDVTLRGAGGFVRIDGAGVTINGDKVRINEGGAPGAGQGAHPAMPVVPDGVKARTERRRLPLLPLFQAPSVPRSQWPGAGTPLNEDEMFICTLIYQCVDVPFHQNCVAAKLNELDQASGGMSPYKSQVPYDMSKTPPEPIPSKNDPSRPTTGSPKESRIPDVTVTKDPGKMPTQDNIKEIIEIKFNDGLTPDQLKSYRRIAGEAPFRVLSPEECGCPPEKKKVPVKEIVAAAALTLAILLLKRLIVSLLPKLVF